MQNFTIAELILLTLVLAIYFLPSLIALLRHHKNKLAIFLLNLFLGCTVIGWVSSLVWSVVR
ncbi:MAG: superinfection immunity protein [Candidatus Omnitrophica bacterium]|nr:superinfection immunity protein [Candidatus Omnitrophota bacterium]